MSHQMIAPYAHALLWAAWKRDSHAVQLRFEAWLGMGVAFEDVNAVDVLLMDTEWRRRAGGFDLFALLRHINPNCTLKAVLQKAGSDSWVPPHVKFLSDGWAPAPSGPPDSSKADAIRWLQRGGEAKLWSQHGSQSHWDRVALLVEHVEAHAPGRSPEGTLAAVERFAIEKGQWLKIAGGLKAQVIQWALWTRPPSKLDVLVEFGTFVGYTAIRLGHLAQHRSRAARCVTVEVDPVQVSIARHFVDVAGLSGVVEVWVGQVKDVAPRLVEEFGHWCATFMFFDHKGNIFHEDIKVVEGLCVAPPSAHLLADNTVSPGCPLFVWRMVHSAAWATTAWCVEEFMEPEQEDWMMFARLRCLTTGHEEEPSAPASWRTLAWRTEHIRRRAEGMRPAAGFLSAADRVRFAQLVRSHYVSFGIEALPWSV